MLSWRLERLRSPLLSTRRFHCSAPRAVKSATQSRPARLIDLGLLGIGGTFSSSQGLRFYQTEIQLIPGASVPAAGFILGVRVNGAPNGTQRTQIDGMDSTNGINSVQAGTGISVDAMQETAIQTSNFAPEFGAVGGGLFNITTRSGTNKFHGAGYDYLANEAFNAATPFTQLRQITSGRASGATIMDSTSAARYRRQNCITARTGHFSFSTSNSSANFS